MSQETPCNAVCQIDPRTNLCFGCGRTLPEIARWGAMDSAERRAIMAPVAGAHAGSGPDARGAAQEGLTALTSAGAAA